MPFYTGSVFYRYRLECGADKTYLLDLTGIECTGCAVHVNGKSLVRLVSPFQFDLSDVLETGSNELEIELICGRKNILGPLHVTREGIVEPDDFRYDSPFWNKRYELNTFRLKK